MRKHRKIVVKLSKDGTFTTEQVAMLVRELGIRLLHKIDHVTLTVKAYDKEPGSDASYVITAHKASPRQTP